MTLPYTPLAEQQIIANMVSTYASLVPTADDLNKGSVIRSILTTFARELKNLYTNQTENTAELQRIAAYSIFGFNLLPAQAAYTMEQFNVSVAPTVDTTVSAGTTVVIDGTTTQYQTVGNFVWPAGSTQQMIRIVCTQSGAVGNTPANTINTLTTPIPGLSNVTVTNPKAVINGADVETEDERAQRFADYLNSVHAGDVSALSYGAKQAKIIDDYGYISEQVVKVQVVEGSGSNSIYIDNGTYDTSTDLVNQAQTIINGYIDSSGNYIRGFKAAGIPSTVIAATIQGVTIQVKLVLATGYTLDMVLQSVSDSISALVLSLQVGETLYLTDIQEAIKAVPGIEDYTITSPTSNVVPSSGTLLNLAAGSPTIN